MYIYHITGYLYFFAVLKICITNTLHCIYIVITKDIQNKSQINHIYIIITLSLHYHYIVYTISTRISPPALPSNTIYTIYTKNHLKIVHLYQS